MTLYKKKGIYTKKLDLKRYYARTTSRMKMTKEQMLVMKHTLMILFNGT